MTTLAEWIEWVYSRETYRERRALCEEWEVDDDEGNPIA